MIDWSKLQPLYERKAYRIVQKHIKSILSDIPINNASLITYEWLIEANITEEQIKSMFLEIYNTIGLNYGNRINNEIEKTKKANILFNEYLLQQILLFLSNEGGVKIVSVRETLIADVIKAIKESLGENATVIELQNAIQKIVSRSQTFYKWQSLRIARTETTSASNLSAIKTAEASDLLMEKEWISVNEPNRTRRDHLHENGQKVDLEDDFIMESGDKMNYPGDVKGKARQVVNCRCTIAFKAKRDEEGMLIFKTNR